MRQIKVYRKEYERLPVRFQKKLESDLNYLIKAEIPGMKKYIFLEVALEGKFGAAVISTS